MPIAMIDAKGNLQFTQNKRVFDGLALRPGTHRIPVAVPDSVTGTQAKKFGELVGDIKDALGTAAPTPDRLARIGNLSQRAINVLKDHGDKVKLTPAQVKQLERMDAYAATGEISDDWMKPHLTRATDETLKQK